MDVGSRSDCSGKAAAGVIILQCPSTRSPASATRAVNASARQREQLVRLRVRRRPHDRHAAPGQRQPREHAAVVAEPLSRTAVMRELAVEIRHDALLAVRLRLGDDACGVANPRAEAVGADDEPCSEAPPVVELSVPSVADHASDANAAPVTKSMPGT